MEPSPSRKPIVRTGNTRLTSSRVSNQLGKNSSQERPQSATEISPSHPYLPHASLILKSFLRIREQHNIKYSWNKLKGLYLVTKTRHREGLLRLKRVFNNKIYGNLLHSFATVFICEAQKAKIKKRDLLTKNKALFLKLWRGVNQIVIRKQNVKTIEAFGTIVNKAKTIKKTKQLQTANLKFIAQLFKQKLKTSF